MSRRDRGDRDRCPSVHTGADEGNARLLPPHPLGENIGARHGPARPGFICRARHTWRPRSFLFYGGRGCPFLSGQKGTKNPPGAGGNRMWAALPPASSTPPPPDPRNYGGGRTGPFSRRPAQWIGTHSRPPMLPPCNPSGECKRPHDKRRLVPIICLVRRWTALLSSFS